jgi:anti-anti-sigma factor
MECVIEQSGGVRIVRVKESKLTYPTLGEFFAEVRGLIEGGVTQLLLDLRTVTYMDSASIGCLMDIHRLLKERNGELRLSGLQPRVQTMISMTGVLRIVEAHADEAAALAAFDAAAGTRG